MKNTKLIFMVFITLLLFSCDQKSEMTPEKFDVAISDSLRAIATNFPKSWEASFDEESSLKPFTKTSDFTLIIDGIYIPDYERWAEVTANSRQYERENYLSYHHNI
jgi:hypothetical protein